MKKLLGLCVALCAGVALGRLFEGVPRTAVAGVGAGGGVIAPCAARNGDVNADGKVDLSDAVTILGHLFLGSPTELVGLCAAPPPASGLPDAGQSKCYGFDANQGRWVEVPCAEAVCKGQDGAYATGCSSEGRFTDNGDGTVTDHCTGLMWQQDTADVNGDGQSTDQDYLPWCAALAYCEGLSFAGHDDWRLPNVRELQSIVDYGRLGPSINPAFGALSTWYLSSTSRAGDPCCAWLVGFGSGDVHGGGRKVDQHCVRAVRSGP